MYHVYRNQAAAAYLSLYFFIFLSLQFSNINIFRHTFLRNCEVLKIETWYACGQWTDVSWIPESGCCCLFVPLFLHVDSGYTCGQWADVSCILESGYCCIFIFLFLHFSFFQFSFFYFSNFQFIIMSFSSDSAIVGL